MTTLREHVSGNWSDIVVDAELRAESHPELSGLYMRLDEMHSEAGGQYAETLCLKSHAVCL